ncbi:MAG: hypothetical protein WA824_17110 [Candidatus Sulfotelmatobacter sp.]
MRSSLLGKARSGSIAGCLSLIIFPLGILSLGIVMFTASLLAPAHAANRKLKPTDAYALLFGTVWGPDNHPVYGVKVEIHRASGKKPHWELYSDHSGEFAQRVPAGEADYVITANLKGVKTKDGQPVHLQEPVKVHVDYDERVDMSLHLTR